MSAQACRLVRRHYPAESGLNYAISGSTLVMHVGDRPVAQTARTQCRPQSWRQELGDIRWRVPLGRVFAKEIDMHTHSQGRRMALLGRWIVLAALLAFSLGSTSPARALVVCFVDDTAIGPTHDGSSWTFAYTGLQTALSACAGGQIWVAAGVYKPGAAQTDTFSILPGTQVYGEFAGTEADVNLRNLIANPTILSGDIDNNDANHLTTNMDLTVADISGLNSFHVVKMDAFFTAITSTTVLDSFVITGGDSSDDYDGGGLLCLSNGAGRPCSPNLNALSFSGNRARYGGALALYGGGAGGVSSPNVSFSYFLGNSAAWSGGAVFNDGSYGGTSNPWFGWVTFEDNDAVGNYAGAVFNFAEHGGTVNAAFFAVRFLNNTAGMLGGAVYNDGGGGTSSPWFSLGDLRRERRRPAARRRVYSGAYDALGNEGVSSPVFSNVTFSDNGHTGGGFVGGALYNDGSYGGVSSPTLKNVTFNANSADSGGAIRNTAYTGGTSAPMLTNVIMWGDIAGWKPEIENSGATPSISHSVIAGSGGSGVSWDSLLGVDAGNNLDANPMLASLVDNWTMALNPGSSAIDAGDDTACTTLPVGSVDQNLVARPAGSALRHRRLRSRLCSPRLCGHAGCSARSGWNPGSTPSTMPASPPAAAPAR